MVGSNKIVPQQYCSPGRQSRPIMCCPTKMQRTAVPSKKKPCPAVGGHPPKPPLSSIIGPTNLARSQVVKWTCSCTLLRGDSSQNNYPLQKSLSMSLSTSLSALPREERRAMGRSTAKTPWLMIVTLDCALATITMGRDRDRTPSPTEFHHHPNTALAASRWSQDQN